MRYSNLLVILLFFELTTLKLFGQKNFDLKIIFPPKINSENLIIYLDNGKESVKYKPIFIRNKIIVSGLFYSKFATVIITYRGKRGDPFYINKFWINEKKASITFQEDDSTLNFLKLNKTKEAYELKGMGEEKFNDYILNEQSNFDGFLKENEDFNSDSLKRTIFKFNVQNLNNKKIEFIKKFPNLYYSLYVLRGLAGYNFSDALSIKSVFKNTLSEEIKKSFEGREIEKILNGRILKSGNLSPNFIAKDVSANKISLLDFKGKFLLLVFWASWCSPCIEELPILKEIRSNYSEDKLKMIFVTLDKDFAKFTKAVKKYDMNWEHIYGDNELIDTFGITGVPQIYLINKNSQIIYIRQEQEVSDLEILKKILLKELIKN